MNHNDINKYDLIDKYLSGGMSSTELDSFRAFLQSNKDFTTDLNIISELGESAGFNQVQYDLRDTLSQIRSNDVNANASQPKSSSNIIYKVLGGLVLLFLAMYMVMKLLSPQSGINNNSDIIQYAYLEPLALTTKSDEVDISQMQTLFNQGDYEAALPLIDNFLENNPRDLDVMLAKGMAHTELKQYNKAHATYEKVENLGPRVKKYLWFDAICYIKEDKTEKAKVLLNQIVSSKSFKHIDASKLLKKLD